MSHLENELFNAIVELNEKDALKITKNKMQSGKDPIAAIEICRKAMSVVGDRFSKGEYFLSDLVVSAEIFREIMEILEPEMRASAKAEKKIGKVVIGTPKGDVHDIGKNIVVGLLRGNGFDVYDLGVDVPHEKFVEKIKEVNPEIVGMSGLIAPVWESMKDTVKAITVSGLRDKLKIIIGGGAVNEDVVRHVDADAFGEDVSKGITICKKWVKA